MPTHAIVHSFREFSPEEAARREAELAAFQAARALYSDGEFDRAAQEFGHLRTAYPAEKTYETYLKRAQILAERSPADWDGIWVLENK